MFYSWCLQDLLFDPAFGDLRKCLFTTEEEYTRFRELVINVSLPCLLSLGLLGSAAVKAGF